MNGKFQKAAPPAMGVSVGTAPPAMDAPNRMNLQAMGEVATFIGQLFQ